MNVITPKILFKIAFFVRFLQKRKKYRSYLRLFFVRKTHACVYRAFCV